MHLVRIAILSTAAEPHILISQMNLTDKSESMAVREYMLNKYGDLISQILSFTNDVWLTCSTVHCSAGCHSARRDHFIIQRPRQTNMKVLFLLCSCDNSHVLSGKCAGGLSHRPYYISVLYHSMCRKKTKLCGPSPRANYNRPSGRRSSAKFVPTFEVR
jgi:hypothetical protein